MMRKVSNKLAVIILALLTLSFVVFSGISYFKSKDTIINLSKDSKQASSKAAEVFVEEFFGTKILAIEQFELFLKQNKHLLNDRQELEVELQKLATAAKLDELYIGFEDTGEVVGAENSKGKISSIYHKTVYRDNFDSRTRGWYKKGSEANGKIAFFDPYVTGTTNKYATGVSKAFIVDGKRIGVIGVDIYIDDLKAALNMIKDTPTSNIVIVDMAKSYFVYHPNYENITSTSQENLAVSKIFLDSHAKDPDHGFEYTYNGEEKIGSCETYKAANWLVCSVNSLSDYQPILNSVLVSQVISSVLFIVFIVGILIFAVTYFLKPLGDITNGLNSFFSFLNYEIKQPVRINIKTTDEFGVMADMINGSIAKIQEAANQDSVTLNQAVDTAKMIEDGNLKARITQNPANPGIVELKNVLNKMLATLEVKVGSDLNEIQKVFDNYRGSNFTAKIQNAKGEVEKATNILGEEIASMLKYNLEK
ncbi:methyl-accepting chemotaxis protein, partial [Campylobacter sp. RM6883]|nr:methyl-accepting chemotaxis protein [Campylobacter sp. RM6883]